MASTCGIRVPSRRFATIDATESDPYYLSRANPEMTIWWDRFIYRHGELLGRVEGEPVASVEDGTGWVYVEYTPVPM